MTSALQLDSASVSGSAASPGLPGERLLLSVVVAVHAGADVLRDSLGALLASDLPRDRWELIVVDDASEDDSALIAAEYADVVVRLPGRPRGPAYARNRGCELASAPVLVLVDADVCVHADVLRRFATLFAENPGASAAFGAYDNSPRAKGLTSRFRNLLHHHVHRSNRGEAETFWAGCGAIRRSALLEVGKFDERRYPRPEIEDIELGRRLRARGHQILLRPGIQGTHLKRWSLSGMLQTDFFRRGVPWTRILLEERAMAECRALNLKPRERICALFVALGVPTLALAALLRSPALAVAGAVMILAMVALNRHFYKLLYRRGGLSLALAGAPLHVLYYLTATLSAFVGLVAHLAGRPRWPGRSGAQNRPGGLRRAG